MSDREPPSIGEATLIQRSMSVITAEVNEKIVIMDIANGRNHSVDDIGGDIWRRLESPCTFGELIDALTADYDADRTAIASDVRKMLLEMAKQDAVKIGP